MPTTTIQTPRGPEQADCFHDEGGLAVTLAVGFRAGLKRYVITHKASGCAVGEEVLGTSPVTRAYRRKGDAVAGLRALLPLGDWTRPGAEAAPLTLAATRVLAELAGDKHTLRCLPRPPRS